MLLLADENFNGRLLRALQRRIPELAVVRIQEKPLSGTKDKSLVGLRPEASLVGVHSICYKTHITYDRSSLASLATLGHESDMNLSVLIILRPGGRL